MKYILIFWTFWATPIPHQESFMADGFSTLAACNTFAEELWKVLQADGATSHIAECLPSPNLDV